MYNEGISRVGDVLDLAVELDIINKHGSWYSYGDIRLGQGRENSKEYMRQNVELEQEIEKAVHEQAMVNNPLKTWPNSNEDDEDDNKDDALTESNKVKK